MSATVAAALKKIAVAILTDKKLRKTFLGMPATPHISRWRGSSSRTSRLKARMKPSRKTVWKKNPFKG